MQVFLVTFFDNCYFFVRRGRRYEELSLLFLYFFSLLPSLGSKLSKTTRAPTDKKRRRGGYFIAEELIIAIIVGGALLVTALIIIGMLLFKIRVRVKHKSDQGKFNFYSKQLREEEKTCKVSFLTRKPLSGKCVHKFIL